MHGLNNFNIFTFSTLVLIPLACHNYRVNEDCIEFLTHQKLQSLFIPTRFYMLSKQCPVSHFQFPVSVSKTTRKKYK